MALFYRDSYLEWLRFANAGTLIPGNMFSMEFAVKYVPGNTAIVESGSFCGLSANVITFFKEVYKKNNPLFCGDRWDFEHADDKDACIGSSKFTHRQYKVFVKKTFTMNVKMFSQHALRIP